MSTRISNSRSTGSPQRERSMWYAQPDLYCRSSCNLLPNQKTQFRHNKKLERMDYSITELADLKGSICRPNGNFTSASASMARITCSEGALEIPQMAFHFLLDCVCQEARNVPSVAHIVYCAVAMDRLHHTHFTCSHLLLLYLSANVSCQEARCV